MASYYTELGVKERDDSQDESLQRRPRARWANSVVDDFMSIGGSNRQTPVGTYASPENYLSVARLFGEFMGNSNDESEHQRLLENLVMQLHDEANSSAIGPPPASQEFIRTLPNIAKNECQDVTCIVCNEEAVPLQSSSANGSVQGEVVTRLPCKHYFHLACVKPWLELHNTCPMCRFEVPSDDPLWLEKKREESRQSNAEFKEMMMYG
ncbi:hypothetical protein GGI07_005304 [Coemansia sp. Benny D115]|nr:hypothetical protein GGI07_005304 [Coemansia sp. Benny D115]